MRRYYSHYTFIYPDIYLKNHVVETNTEYQIIRIFPFDKEIERTVFYSGLLLFLPDDTHPEIDIENMMKGNLFLEEESHTQTRIPSKERYKVVHREDFSLSSASSDL
jgi:hypothetical protein